MHLFIEAILAYVATVGFGIILNIPQRALNVAGWIGAAGWAVYEGIISFTSQPIPLSLMAIGMLTAGLIIGGLSNWAAKVKRMPVILFNIPSLVPLVPGGQAYQVVRNIVTGHLALAMDYLGQVVAIAGMIALGFMLAELLLVRLPPRLHRVGR